MKIDKHAFLRKQLYVQMMTPTERLEALIRRLHPVKTPFDLIRVGGQNDGGYLVPDDLAGISACFSPGVGPTCSFESDLLEKFNIASHLCDHSVDGPPGNFAPASFEKRFIGVLDDGVFTTLDSWMERKPELGQHGDLLLQMDIEGGEYAALLSVSERNLRRFRILVIEFHHAEHWSDPVFFGLVEAMFAKLLNHFHVVHIHPNNHGRFIELGHIPVPETFEMSFIRKDRCEPLGYVDILPHPSDNPCLPGQPELTLPRAWLGAP